jgi:hypothetical protein
MLAVIAAIVFSVQCQARLAAAWILKNSSSKKRG